MCLNHGFSDKQFATQGTRPEGVQVRAVEGSQVTVLELKTHPEDLGNVIGRQGRTAKAIRTLLGAAGVKLHKRFTLEILED